MEGIHSAAGDILTFRDPLRLKWWEGLTPDAHIEWITGQLWNCTDSLGSGGLADEGLDDWGQTYGIAARAFRSSLAFAGAKA